MKGKGKLLKTILIGIPIIVFLLWMTGSIQLWFDGIRYFHGNVEDYYLEHSIIDGEYSVTIDLSDPNSNEGKILYDDGENQIYVSEVIIRDENYQVYFQTSGKYSLKGASLVSTTKQSRVENWGFTYNFEGNAFATYRGHTYKVSESGSSGINYRDGDIFGVHLTPNDTELTIDIAEEPMIKVTISNLIMHKWGRN
mgnify:FL=1